MKQLTENDRAALITLLAVLLGGFLRFYPPLAAGFPINDGGMFYVMIDELAANHFIIPKYTAYNFLSIPFAYPPLAFYVGAALKTFFHLDTIEILMILPALVSTLAILAFQFMAQQVFPDARVKASLATAAFAMMPRSYSWFVAGGGLTRSFGQLFLLLMLAFTIRMYKRGEKHDVWMAGMLGSLAVLSHPEATLHAITASVLFYVFLSRNRTGLFYSLLVALLVIVVTAPWWATIMSQHGLAPLLNAGQTGGNWGFGLATFFRMIYPEERLATLITVFGLIGLADRLARKEYFLPAWLVIHFIILPRSATAVSIYPLALMASIALTEIILPALARSNRFGTTEMETSFWLQSRISRWFLGVSMLYALISAFVMMDLPMAESHLATDSRAAMEWASEKTEPGSRFLTMGEPTDFGLHRDAEWFPALARRHSILTLQGREWIWGEQFIEAIEPYVEVQTCLFQDLACLEEKSANLRLDYDYIYLQRPSASQFEIKEGGRVELLLAQELKESPSYRLVYEMGNISIYRRE